MISAAIRATLFLVTSGLLSTVTAQAQPAQPSQDPPPVVVVGDMPGVPPNSVVIQQTTPLGYTAYYRNIERAEPIWPGPGMRASFTGGFESHSHLLGATAALRYRTSSLLALDFGAGFLLGSDDLHSNRREIPIFVDALVYLIPRPPVQLYLVGGAHGAFAHADGTRTDTGIYESVDGFYLGGQAGLGIELRLHPFVYVVTDVRGAMRKLLTGPTTLNYNADTWTAGLVFNAGLLFYF